MQLHTRKYDNIYINCNIWPKQLRYQEPIFFIYLRTGTVKKCALLKIVHERFKTSKRATDPDYLDYVQSFDEALGYNKEIEALISKSSQVKLLVTLYGKICVSTTGISEYDFCLLALIANEAMQHLLPLL